VRVALLANAMLPRPCFPGCWISKQIRRAAARGPGSATHAAMASKRAHLRDLLLKAQVQQAVGFIQHQPAQLLCSMPCKVCCKLAGAQVTVCDRMGHTTLVQGRE
jgi:hypothetical protein